VTRVDFYSLREGSAGDRFLLACRLVERIHAEDHRIYIHVPDREQARHLDRLLWTFRQQSFLPHGIYDEADRELTPILIGVDKDPVDEDQVLINLGLEVPEFFGRFARLCEPVDRDPGVLAAGRERFKYYKDRGYALHHHEIRL
jgi:DNA polymerase-3 subunit chi